MNLPLFLARRIHHSERADHTGKRRQMSRPAVRIATLGVAIGMAVMLLSIAVAAGFKSEVRQRVTGLAGHVQMANYHAVSDFQSVPLHCSDTLLRELGELPGVAHVQRYSYCSGVLMTDESFQGIRLKGVGQDYDTAFFAACLVEGSIPCFSDSLSSNRILLSQTVARKLKLGVGDRVSAYFLGGGQQMRARRFTVAGIFQTHFSVVDEQLVLTDLRTVGRLNQWGAQDVSGLELTLAGGADLAQQTLLLRALYDRRGDGHGGLYRVQNVEELNPGIFAWLSVLNVNIWVILILMLGVAGFTMISGLLILIIERTSMIGILKSLGADNSFIRRMFLWLAVFIIGRGMLWGNTLWLAFYIVQTHTGLLRLDPEMYYMDTVPVHFSLVGFVLLNAGTLIASVLMLVGPSYLVAHIRPTDSMRYE